MYIIVFFLSSFLGCALISRAFPIEVENMEVLNQRKLNATLLIHLNLSEAGIANSDLGNASLSIMMNARVCFSFEESVFDINLFLPHVCVSDGPFWFSLLLTAGGRKISSTPIFVPKREISAVDFNQLTLVLPLTLDDIPRGFVLMSSLQHVVDSIVKELLIFVPHSDQKPLKQLLQGIGDELMFPVSIYSENVLLHRDSAKSNTYPYAKQMAIKILAASMVSTNFYMTLDADLILLRRIKLSDLFDVCGRAKYDHESRDIHQAWWNGSEKFLRTSFSSEEQLTQGFGVTPAILSTYGSLLVRNMVMDIYEEMDVSHGVSHWVASFGHNDVVWSEYTMYRIALDSYRLFDELHFPSGEDKLHCFDIWYASDFPWDYSGAVRSKCTFSVVQSSTGVSATTLYSHISGREK